MKYWNERRIKRLDDRKKRSDDRVRLRAAESERARATYTKGDARKNSALMFKALGSDVNRKLLARLCRGGAMSVSKLAEPLRLRLTHALLRVRALESAGLITTHKQGRVRLCVYNPAAPKELSAWLLSRDPFGAA